MQRRMAKREGPRRQRLARTRWCGQAEETGLPLRGGHAGVVYVVADRVDVGVSAGGERFYATLFKPLEQQREVSVATHLGKLGFGEMSGRVKKVRVAQGTEHEPNCHLSD